MQEVRPIESVNERYRVDGTREYQISLFVASSNVTVTSNWHSRLRPCVPDAFARLASVLDCDMGNVNWIGLCQEVLQFQARPAQTVRDFRFEDEQSDGPLFKARYFVYDILVSESTWHCRKKEARQAAARKALMILTHLENDKKNLVTFEECFLVVDSYCGDDDNYGKRG
jgi:hypothetical protein